MALVSYVLGDCPGCGTKDSFGNIDVYGTRVSLGCGRCSYKESRPLPRITKKILYLDQYFFSHAVRGSDAKFTAAAKLIRELVGLQLLAVPYSDVHEDETHQWAGHEQLLEFIKYTSGGHEFSQTYRVEMNQLNSAFEAFLQGLPAAYVLQREDALHDEIDEWDGYYRIEVGGYHGVTAHPLRSRGDADWLSGDGVFDRLKGRETMKGAGSDDRADGGMAVRAVP